MPADFSTAAQFSRELLDASLVQGMELAGSVLDPLISRVTLGNNQGNHAKYVVYGGRAKPRELYQDPINLTDKIGSYTFTIRPVEYGGGFQMHDNEIADATSPDWLQRAREFGAEIPPFHDERLLGDIMESATLFDGFDGQPLYSNTHTWTTSDTTPGAPAATYGTALDNIYDAASGSTDYASAAAVGTDFHGALAQMNGWKDDKGREITHGDQFYVVYNNKTPALDQYLNAYFNPNSLASDDSLRDGWRFKVKLIPAPYLTATGGSTDFDWYLFRLRPGYKPPLVIQERQALLTESGRDPKTRMNWYQYTIRYGYGWTNWWQTIKVDKS